MIIDSHLHLWQKQAGTLAGKPVYAVGGGKSRFGDEIVQMQPPYMTNGENTVETLLSNMDYARVSAAVVTQEVIDGVQDAYLLRAKAAAEGRLKVCSLFIPGKDAAYEGFDGLKISAQRLETPDLLRFLPVFRQLEARGMFLSIDLMDGDTQTGMLREICEECLNLKIAIGHFGMAGRGNWREQIRLARYPNVRIESGGITWLFHKEYYPYPSAVRAILESAEICGMNKLMWGSDYPRTMTAITYLQSLDFVQKSAEMTENDKLLFLGENARRFYGFSNLPVPPRVRNMVEDE